MRGFLRNYNFSTGENIHRGVVILRPCVDGKMGLGDDNHPAYPEWVELMERDLDDGRLCLAGGADHNVPDAVQIMKDSGAALPQFEQQMCS